MAHGTIPYSTAQHSTALHHYTSLLLVHGIIRTKPLGNAHTYGPSATTYGPSAGDWCRGNFDWIHWYDYWLRLSDLFACCSFPHVCNLHKEDLKEKRSYSCNVYRSGVMFISLTYISLLLALSMTILSMANLGCSISELSLLNINKDFLKINTKAGIL